MLKPAKLQSKTKLEREIKVSIEWILKSVTDQLQFSQNRRWNILTVDTDFSNVSDENREPPACWSFLVLIFFLSLSELESVRRYGKLPIFSSEINFLKFVDYQLSLTFYSSFYYFTCRETFCQEQNIQFYGIWK